MKKIFAVFCAVVLMPSFSAHAWIGGPFSNNSFFGEAGDDGVYEAAASALNGIGLYRIVVGNTYEGINPAGVTTSSQVASGNVVIGAYEPNFTTFSNVWFYEGVFYAGVTLGTASSVMGTVTAFAEALDDRGMGFNILSSSFIAHFQGTGRFLPARVFSGRGLAQLTGDDPFEFGVYGSKVSHTINLGL